MGSFKMLDEEYLSKKRAIELWDLRVIGQIEVGTFKGLQQIHQYLFKDVLSFAGQLRNENISKGNYSFASVLFLEANLKIIDQMPMTTFDEILEKYVEMNIAHPFFEGNGRATRIWLDLMLKKSLNLCIAWEKISPKQYLLAMERSPINTLEIRSLLNDALTDDIHNRDLYLKGIQQSYVYEDLGKYNIDELDRQ